MKWLRLLLLLIAIVALASCNILSPLGGVVAKAGIMLMEKEKPSIPPTTVEKVNPQEEQKNKEDKEDKEEEEKQERGRNNYPYDDPNRDRWGE